MNTVDRVARPPWALYAGEPAIEHERCALSVHLDADALEGRAGKCTGPTAPPGCGVHPGMRMSIREGDLVARLRFRTGGLSGQLDAQPHHASPW